MSRVSLKVVEQNATDWAETTIGEQVLLQRGVDITRAEQRPGCVPVISSGGVTSFHDTPAATGPGVVLGRKGVVGSVYFVDTDYWPHDTTLWVKDFKGNLPRFVYYFFRGMTQYLTRLDVGSANPTLNRNHVHPIQVRWPPLPEQRAIARVLGTLDDKIELNRKMSETLEELARTLFKSWFVDFDPVHAKAGGKKPFGMDDATAALFPDSFEDSELGPIPRGWRVAVLGEVVQLTKGRSYNRDELAPSPVSLVTLKSFHRGGGYRVDGLKPYTGTYRDEQIVRTGEVVLALTDVTQAAELVGRPAIIPDESHRATTLVASLDVAVVRSELLPREYLFEQLRDSRFTSFATSMCSGTTVLHLHVPGTLGFPMVVPSAPLMQRFNELASKFRARSEAATAESRTLAELRDTLLPKLLSGELRVPLDVTDGPTAKAEQLGLFPQE